MRAKRIALGYSQVGLSEATGIRQTEISLLEVGRLIPTDAQRDRIARVLQIPPDLLLQPVPLGEPEPEPAGAGR